MSRCTALLPHALVAAAVLMLAAPAAAQSYLAKSQPIGGNPGPAHNYVCPNVDGGPALDCFLDAVRHLYTMCKHVKSIEIIEFGYEQSEEGTNGAKSAYCVDKQKLNMARPYQAALRETTTSRQAVEMVRALHEYWVDSLAKLRWNRGESDDDYKDRTAKVYVAFDERITGIKTIVATVRERVTPAAAAKPSGSTARAKADR
jgi:hypothetical protein